MLAVIITLLTMLIFALVKIHDLQDHNARQQKLIRFQAKELADLRAHLRSTY